jgi:nicotinamide-nucleotide amidase
MMRVGVCSVGAELLSGEIADGNAAWLLGAIVETGAEASGVIVIGDGRTEILQALRWLAERSDVLVVGGGLGPTADDLTRYAVADFAGVALERRPELVDHLDRIYARLERAMPDDALRQADLPVGAVFHDPQGTAAGFSLDVVDGARTIRVHVLPGVPWEYRGIAESVVLPELTKGSGGVARVTRTLHIAGLGESGVGEALRHVSDRLESARSDATAHEHGIELGYLARAGEVLVKVTATGTDPAAARERASSVVEECAAILGEAVTSIDERRLEDEVALLLDQLGCTVATAESFTAGRIAASLSSPEGAAGYLRGGIIAFSPAMLVDLAQVTGDVVAAQGERSDAVLTAMAAGVRERSGADYAIATVGVVDEADATEEFPVGSAAWAIARPDGRVVVERRYIPAADRDIIQTRGAAFALESFRRVLVAQRDQRVEGAGVAP